MVIRLEPRGEIAKGMIYGSPLVAVAATLMSGLVLFAILGVNPVDALFTFFISPISSLDGWAELFVKATPLVLIAVWLSFGFQANVWNIGAEGQFAFGQTRTAGQSIRWTPTLGAVPMK